MTYNRDIHNRHSIRLADYDYSEGGAYLVTICTWQRKCLFGEIVNGAMVLNDMRLMVASEWQRTSQLRSNVELDVHTIMPNHFHAIFLIHEPGISHNDSVGATRWVAQVQQATMTDIATKPWRTSKTRATQRVAPTGPMSGSVGAIMAQFKSIVTKRINIMRINPGCPVWQRNYYERVIRNDDELTRAREYIVNNPAKWELDTENPINVPPTTANDP